MMSVIVSSLLSATVAVAVGAVLVVAAAVCLPLKFCPRCIPICFLFSVIGIFLYVVTMQVKYDVHDRYGGQTCEVTGQVTDGPMASYDNVRYEIHVTSVNGQKENFYLRLTTGKGCQAELYDTISLSTELKVPENVAGTGFSNKNYLLSKGIAFTAYAEAQNISVNGKGERPVFAAFSDIRQAMLKACGDFLGDDIGVAAAVMLGDKSFLTEEQRDNFSMIGVSHLFAVSGLHLSVLLAAFMWLAKKVRMHRIAVLISGIVLIFAFMGITGFSVSVLRAGIMGILTLGGLAIFKEADPMNSLGAAVAVIILINPLSALDIGLQMSVCATAGLILISPRMAPKLFASKSSGAAGSEPSAEVTTGNETETVPAPICETQEETEAGLKLISGGHAVHKPSAAKLLRGFANIVVGSVVTSVSANIFLLPIYAYNFGSISLITPLANLLLVPAGSAVLILTLISCMIYFIPAVGAPAAVVTGVADRIMIRYINGVSDWLAGIKWQNVGIAGTCAKLTIAFIVVSVIFWLNKKHTSVSGRMAAASCAAVFAVGMISNAVFCSGQTNVYFWGTESSCCAVINCDGQSVAYCADGYYADYVWEYYQCIDGCFKTQMLSSESVQIAGDTVNIGDWSLSLIRSSSSPPAVIMSNGEVNILLTDSPDDTVADAVLKTGLYFDVIYLRQDDDCATYMLTDERIGDTVIISSGYGAFPETKAKLIAKSYSVNDVTGTGGIKLTLSPDGGYSLKSMDEGSVF